MKVCRFFHSIGVAFVSLFSPKKYFDEALKALTLLQILAIEALLLAKAQSQENFGIKFYDFLVKNCIFVIIVLSIKHFEI